MASLEMFKAGYFSSESLEPCQVDSAGLEKLTVQQLEKGLQVSESNPIMGLEGRASLLSKLGDALRNKALFGMGGRPGHMLGKDSSEQSVSITLISSRLPTFTHFNPSFICPHRHSPYPVGRAHQRACNHLAHITHTN